MPEIALQENGEKDADFFADVYEALTRWSFLPEWMRYNAHLHDEEYAFLDSSPKFTELMSQSKA